ncbi:hypothetical protein EAI_07005 [Harpegnathos saltator]|uniref:Uncharacterized protein n=1 Tax=Harpegnathos saltator TaxID=610380 RepID=E2BF97_HARSA|nr:hypothetical protein EAI_07005 [Harpegnathos saltator]
MKKAPTMSRKRSDRLSSTGSNGSLEPTAEGQKSSGIDLKIDWIVKAIKEMRDEIACKKEIKLMIKEVVQEEIGYYRQELKELKQKNQEGIVDQINGAGGSTQRSYCSVTIIRGLGMKQYVNKPTRITKDSQTIIDLVLANGEVKVQVKDRPKITDHAWLQVELGSSRSEKKYREFSGRDYSKFNSSEFLRLLELKIIQGQGLCVNTRAEKLA